jgi:hypothetical protein
MASSSRFSSLSLGYNADSAFAKRRKSGPRSYSAPTELSIPSSDHWLTGAWQHALGQAWSLQTENLECVVFDLWNTVVWSDREPRAVEGKIGFGSLHLLEHLDPLLEGNDFVVAGHDDDGSKF